MALLDRLGATRDQRVAPPAQEAPPPQVPVVLAGIGVAIALGGYIFVQSGQVPGLLFLIGLALGLVLFNSRFGFTSAWRQLVAVRQGKALRAHMLMLATACLLFAPILANQVSFKDVPVAPSLAPIGWGLFVGAFLFGVGMQLGGSCASGTLFAIGSGQSAIVLTLVGFIGGATLGAYHLPWWNELPAHDPVSLTQFGGYPGALAISLLVMAAIVGAHLRARPQHRRPRSRSRRSPAAPRRVVRGSWPLWVGALLLAGLNALTLFVSGGAWGVTFAFALWGSKILDLVGVDVLSWGFWQDPANLAKYDAGIFVEKTSVMDFGIIVGALIASAAAGQWILHRRVPAKLALGARHRRDPDGVRRPPGLRLQHRRLLRRHRVVLPARLDLGRDGHRRHRRRPGAAAALRADQPEADRLGLLTGPC